jgi:hypothetical protein
VSGKLRFAAGVVCQGTVEFCNSAPEPKTIEAGTYRNSRVSL